MKIILVSRIYPPDPHWSGVSVFYQNMATKLAESGHEVNVVCRTSVKQNAVSEHHNLKIHRVGPVSRGYSTFDRMTYMVLAWLKVRQLLKNRGADLICTTFTDAEGFFYALFEKVPLAITFHSASETSIQSKNYSGFKERIILKVLSHLENLTARRAKKIIANSLESYDLLTKTLRVDPQKIDLIPHAIDTLTFIPGTPEPDLEAAITQRSEVSTVLVIGRLESRKGFQILIEAIPSILAQKPDTKFVFLGDDTHTAPDGGSFKQFIISRSREQGYFSNLVFMDGVSREKLIQLYQSCDLYVSPSLKESFGLTVIEAMSCGKPVVATATGIVPELQKNNLEGLCIVPPSNAEDLSKAITHFLSLGKEKLNQMGVENRNCIEKQFSYKQWTDRTIEVFREAIEKRPSRSTAKKY